MTVGEKIKSLRLGLCMNQEEFAKLVGSNRETVCRWETGKGVPSVKSIKKIANFINIDPKDISKHLK